MHDSRTKSSSTASAEQDVAQDFPPSSDAANDPPVVASSDYDRAYQQRRRGIYVLAGVCVVFFVVIISACYAAAVMHGYGTGFGDGKELPARLPRLGGTGFWGDLGLLAGAVVIDLIILFVWYFAASRMDQPSVDDPVAPDDGHVDLRDGASWYLVEVPALTKCLMVVAVGCLVGIVVGASAVLPVVAIRYGWVL